MSQRHASEEDNSVRDRDGCNITRAQLLDSTRKAMEEAVTRALRAHVDVVTAPSDGSFVGPNPLPLENMDLVSLEKVDEHR